MTTFQTSSWLCKPEGENKIPLEEKAYFQARNRNNVYDIVVREFINSGISQATLARRLGKRREVVNRLLGAPGNWTLDTVSDLLLAISGSEVEYQISYPFDKSKRNFNGPEWISEGFQADIGREKSVNPKTKTDHTSSFTIEVS